MTDSTEAARDGVQVRTAEAGDPMFDLCFRAMDAMREATTFMADEMADPRDAITAIMTAAAMFSGMQAGTLLAIGALHDKDKRRTVEMMANNFRQGMRAGQQRGARIEREIMPGASQ